MPRLARLALLVVLLGAGARAQSSAAGLSVVFGFPQGRFADRVGAVGVGLSGTVLHRPGGPVAIGFEGSYLVYGLEGEWDAVLGLGEGYVTTNNLAIGHLLLRLQGGTGAVRPYADALAGVSLLFTESTYHYYGESDYSELDLADAAFSYGVGGGLQVALRPAASTGLLVDLRVRYLFGTEAAYLRPGDFAPDVQHSRTDLLLPQLGVTVQF